VWVILDTDQDTASKVRDIDQPQSDTSALISAKDETIAALRDQLEAERQAHAEARRIIAGLVERIPALEPPRGHTADAPPEPSRSRESASEEARSGHVPPKAKTPAEQRRPWWRRWLGG
jgi:hypothetical protein